MDMAKCGIGFTCRKGLKPESPNQEGLSWVMMTGERCDISQSYSTRYLLDGQDASTVVCIYRQACGVRLVFGAFTNKHKTPATMSSIRGIPSIQFLDSSANSILLRLRFMMTKISNLLSAKKLGG